jgi:hypothetical protein
LKILKGGIFYSTKYSIGIHSHLIILVSDEHISLGGYACDLYSAVAQFDLWPGSSDILLMNPAWSTNH